MAKKWYQKTSIQAAIITGMFMLAAAVISISHYWGKGTQIQTAETVAKKQPVSSKSEVSSKLEKQYPESIPLSFSQYLDRDYSLRDRFLEQEEFAKSLVGKEVIWEGFVDRVFTYHLLGSAGMEQEETIGLALKADKSEKNVQRAFISYDASWKTKLFSLRKNDRIRIQGIIEGGKYPPGLKGISLELIVEKASKIVPKSSIKNTP